MFLDGWAVNTRLADIVANGIPVHAAAGLAGWLTFTAIGVSYRLLAMFMLAPEGETARSRAVLNFGTAALALAILGGAGAISLGRNPSAILLAATLLGSFALVLYGTDVLHLYRARNQAGRWCHVNATMSENLRAMDFPELRCKWETAARRALRLAGPLVALTLVLGGCAFRSDLAAMRHETQYTRLFRS